MIIILLIIKNIKKKSNNGLTPEQTDQTKKSCSRFYVRECTSRLLVEMMSYYWSKLYYYMRHKN